MFEQYGATFILYDLVFLDLFIKCMTFFCIFNISVHISISHHAYYFATNSAPPPRIGAQASDLLHFPAVPGLQKIEFGQNNHFFFLFS